MPQITVNQLKNLPLFKEIDDKSINLIKEKVYIKNLKKGESLFSERQKVESIYIVLEGKVTMYRLSEKGQKRVVYILNKGEIINVHNPGTLPDSTHTDRIEEPYIKAQIISKPEYIGNIMTLCISKRGMLISQGYLSPTRVELVFEMPLTEIVFDFYDKLKSQTRGYASFDYHPIGFRDADIVRMDILLNNEKVDALSALIHRSRSAEFGRKLCEKLKTLLDKQQFQVAIQAAIGAKIIARENISAMRKDVTAKCYGGDISRKRKLLDKQKEGKKRMRQIGNVEVPQEAFLAVLKLDD